MIDKTHIERVRLELKKAGVSSHAFHKNEVSYLPNVIHSDEHIGAAINGRTAVGSVMLVATDKRVIYLDCKLFYTTVDEVSYDVVSGVSNHTQGLFSNIILHTRVGEYDLRLVNTGQARIFVAYLEKKRLENADSRTRNVTTSNGYSSESPHTVVALDKKQRTFLYTHNLGVISTVDRTSNVNGAAVYYLADQDNLYVLTKSETSKARNILVHSQVALTIIEELTYESLQLKGIAGVVVDNEVRNRVFNHILKIRNLKDQTTLPPVTKIQEGSYVVIKISITEAKYNKYKD